jgi:XTP/dITP diphosphohydrolase
MQKFKEIVLASSNRNKLKELQSLLAGRITVVPQSEFEVTEADETGLTFVENAIIKARNACLQTGLPSIADDSGLQVDFLDGAPGIRSARYAGDGATDEDNNRKLLRNLAGASAAERAARFHCTIVMMKRPDDATPIICQGRWHGSILDEPRGANGFGYDPLFYLKDQSCSAAELAPEIKNRISHRAMALVKLIEAMS